MKRYTTEEIINKLNRKNKIKKIISGIFYPIFILILVCMIILLIQKMKNPDRIPSLFGYKIFTIVSGSMEPTLNIGDLIVIKEADQSKIKEQDIISFREEKSIITHRVTKIIEESGQKLYQTKGDNNNKDDDKMVNYEEIEGVYNFKVPYIGKIVILAQNVWGIIIIFGVIYVIYIISDEREKRKISRHEKRKQYERETEK